MIWDQYVIEQFFLSKSMYDIKLATSLSNFRFKIKVQNATHALSGCARHST